jgi:hypothetical protein
LKWILARGNRVSLAVRQGDDAMELKDTVISRGGATSRTWYESYKNCEFNISRDGDSLEFTFSMPSKGGGTTDVRMNIGKADVAAIVGEIVNKWPGNIRTTVKFMPDE